MDAQHFDRLTRHLGRRWSRRHLAGLLAVAVSTRPGLTRAAPVSGQRLPLAQRQEANTTCQNLGTACGDTRVCQCLLDKDSLQTCQNVVDPPSARGFAACQTSANCPPGQVCDARASVCRLTCATPVPSTPPRSSDGVTCQNLGTACGNTAICECRLDTSSAQICQNRVVAPNGVAFLSCDANDDCGPNQVCDAIEHVCVSTCAN
jgi:hypothetical protein